MEESNFRVASHKFHLTYKTHINPKEWMDFFENKFSQIKYYSIAQETGEGDENNNYPHTHILVDFSEKIFSKKSNLFDFKLKEDNDYWTNPYWNKYRDEKPWEYTGGIHPNIKTVRDKFHWNTIIEYHRKQPDVILFTNVLSEEEKRLKEIEEKKANCRRCANPAFSRKHTCGIVEYKEKKEIEKKVALGLKELQQRMNEDRNFNPINHYGGDDIKTIATIEKAMRYIREPIGIVPTILWKLWQMNLLKELSEKALDRLIVWYYDSYGRAGKSQLAEHLNMYYGVIVLTTLDISTVGLLIKDFYNLTKKITRIIFDLPRKYNIKPEHYQTLELIKSGKILSSKYHCENVKFGDKNNDKPHVVVFSNEMPDFEYLTEDKIGLRIIDNTGNDINYKNEIIPDDIILPEGFDKLGTVIKKEIEEEEEEDETYCKKFKFHFTEDYINLSKDYWHNYYLKMKEREPELEKLRKERKLMIELLKNKMENEEK